MGEDSLKKVKEWLDKQGFPLEMRVAAEFRRAGFWVAQSEYFEDPTTGTFREMDVTARLQMAVGGDLARVTFSVECKHGRKPWVIFTTGASLPSDQMRVSLRPASALGRNFLRLISKLPEVQALPVFAIPDRAGYSLTESMRDDPNSRDPAYQALTGAVAASVANARAADELAERNVANVVEVGFPMIVVDGQLFEAYLDNHAR